MKKLLFLLFIAFSLHSQAQKCSFYIVGINYAIDNSNKDHSLTAEWKNNKIMLTIKIPSKYFPGAFDNVQVEVKGSTEGIYPIGIDQSNGTGFLPNSIQAIWFDANKQKRQLVSNQAAQVVTGRIFLKTIVGNSISGNFAMNVNREIVEGSFSDLVVKNFPVGK